jgi:AraC-like DNA-binding protein
MSRAGTSTFDNPDRYRERFRGADVKLVFTAPGVFRARLTWAELPHLSLMATRESVARIASIVFDPGRAFISFPTATGDGAIWNGVELLSNEIVLHRPGSRTHERTTGSNSWGFISIDPSHLLAVGSAIAGQKWARPISDVIIQPPVQVVKRLRRLHAKACRLAEDKPQVVMHREGGRAIEQELIRALIDCLAVRQTRGNAKILARHIGIMAAFEEALAANIERDVGLVELSDLVGVPGRTLRLCCEKFLGMGPHRYLQLRRLHSARAALQRADPETGRVAEIAQRYRFMQLGRFAASYRAVFGEMPSNTLRQRSRFGERGFAANA